MGEENEAGQSLTSSEHSTGPQQCGGSNSTVEQKERGRANFSLRTDSFLQQAAKQLPTECCGLVLSLFPPCFLHLYSVF